jgi:hypothetical protein
MYFSGSLLLNFLVSVGSGLFLFVCFSIGKFSLGLDRDLRITLLALPATTFTILSAVVNSIPLSLGLLGALSIVRYRTPIKSAANLLFILIALSFGVVCAADLINLVFPLAFFTLAICVASRYVSVFPGKPKDIDLFCGELKGYTFDEIKDNFQNLNIEYKLNSVDKKTNKVILVEFGASKEQLEKLIENFDQNKNNNTTSFLVSRITPEGLY